MSDERKREEDSGGNPSDSDLSDITLSMEEDLYDQEGYAEQVGQELTDAGKLLAETLVFEGSGDRSWQAATNVVHKVRPVPWLFWVIIHSVFGKSGELGKPDAMAFSIVKRLMLRATRDKTLSGLQEGQKESGEVRLLSEAISVIGPDVAGALCFMHSVCRRVSSVLADQVWRPILDDALLRAHIGHRLGLSASKFGAGRGMLAGFAGRCGLAVQIASGSLDDAQRALTGLASGTDMGEICRDIYGCDPLQVSALSLISGGCSRDIALGVSSYSNPSENLAQDSEQIRWLCAFTIVEKLRMGLTNDIPARYWYTLGVCNDDVREGIIAGVQQIQRKGHGWRWMVKSVAEPKPTNELHKAEDGLKHKKSEHRKDVE